MLAHLEQVGPGPPPFLVGLFGDWRVAVLNLEDCDEDSGLVVERVAQSVSDSLSASLTTSVSAPIAASRYGAVSVARLLEMARNAWAPEIALFVGSASPMKNWLSAGDVVVGAAVTSARRSLLKENNVNRLSLRAVTNDDVNAVCASGEWIRRWLRRDCPDNRHAVIGNIVVSNRGMRGIGRRSESFGAVHAVDLAGTALCELTEDNPVLDILFIRGIARRSRQISADSAAAFTFEFLAYRSGKSDPIPELRGRLLGLSPDDFERVVAAGLSGILGVPFRQAASGLQPSGDVGGGSVRVEAKRYRSEAPRTRDLLGSLTATVTAVPDLSHWVVASTVALPLQAVDELHQAAMINKVYDVVLDWPDFGIPPLAAALALGRAEVVRTFPDLAPVLHRLAEQPEVIEAGEDIRAALRSDPLGRPIYNPVLRSKGGSVSASVALDPRYQVVPLLNRGREVGDWLNWAQGNEPARLLTGAGGMGKTRLLIEVCERLRREGWRTGFLKEGASEDDLRRQLAGRDKFLIVVDYAARRDKDMEALCEAIRATGATVKLALLDRRDGPWRQELCATTSSAVAEILGDEGGISVLQLEPAAPVKGDQRLRDRKTIFELAVTAYAGQFDIEIGDAQGREIDFSNPDYDRILLFLLEAWMLVFGNKSEQSRSPVRVVLDREQRYLKKLAPADLPARSLMEVLAWIYLHGGSPSRRDAIALLTACPALAGQSAAMISKVADVFHEAYPGPHWLNPIQPDLIGSAVVEEYGP